MRRETEEWIAKADGDLRTARRELATPSEPNFDAVCFHAQQRAEKCLKARLVEAGIVYPRTHDLDLLLRLVQPIEPAWAGLRERLQRLTDMAVEVRYPGCAVTLQEASEALATADAVRAALRAGLG